MKTRTLTIVAVTSIILFTACSSLKVTVDYDKSVDFSKYKTFEFYGWAEQSEEILSPFDKKRIETAFENEMNQRGLEYVESGADLILTLYIQTEEKTEVQATTTTTGGYGYGGYYGYGPRYGWGPGYGYGQTTTTYDEYNYLMGTLIIDIYDAAEEQLVFESAGTKQFHPNQDSTTKEKIIKQVADQMMYKYPVKPKK